MENIINESSDGTGINIRSSIEDIAISQAKQFMEVCDVSGIILTKLDGTAKGGVVIGISDSLIGIISSLVTFAFLFKLGAIYVMQKISNIKKTSIICENK